MSGSVHVNATLTHLKWYYYYSEKEELAKGYQDKEYYKSQAQLAWSAAFKDRKP